MNSVSWNVRVALGGKSFEVPSTKSLWTSTSLNNQASSQCPFKNGGKASPPVRVLVSGPEKSLAPPLCLWDNSSPDLLRNEVLQWCGRQWCGRHLVLHTGMGHGSPGDLSASSCFSRTVQRVLVFRPFGNRDN